MAPTTDSVRLVAIVGSLRRGSINGALARAAAVVVPDDVAYTVHSVADLPLYNGDDEAGGPPAEVVALREAVASSDGLVFFSPEYNGSLPAVTKNVIDWLSRDASTWDGVGVTMVSISPGPRAGIGARELFSRIMARQAPREFDTLGFGVYGERIDPTGEVTDSATLDELGDFLGRFAAHCRR